MGVQRGLGAWLGIWPGSVAWERCLGAWAGSVASEAVNDLEVRSAEVPKLFLDITIRHVLVNDAGRPQRAAQEDGATNAEAEADERDRYPAGRCFHALKTLVLETFRRHGRTAPKHLRKLARKQAETLDEGAEV